MHLILNPNWRRGCVLALAAICAPATGLAQSLAKDSLHFPASLDHEALADWMARETDLPADQVVAISPVALVAITQTRPMTSPEGFEVTVRAETIDEGFSRQEGLASWNATMKLACKDKTFAMGAVTGHTAHSLKGEARPMQTAMEGWRPVTPGTIQGEIWNARCAAGFKAPLADLATPPASKLAATPASSPPPPLRAALPASPEPTPPPAKPVPPPKPQPAPPQPASKPTPAPALKSGRPASAQILSAPTADEANRALTKLKSKLGGEMSGLGTGVVPVLTDGKTRYRAIVTGFQTTGEAARFCEKVTTAGGKCLPRGDAGRASSEKAP